MFAYERYSWCKLHVPVSAIDITTSARKPDPVNVCMVDA